MNKNQTQLTIPEADFASPPSQFPLSLKTGFSFRPFKSDSLSSRPTVVRRALGHGRQNPILLFFLRASILAPIACLHGMLFHSEKREREDFGVSTGVEEDRARNEVKCREFDEHFLKENIVKGRARRPDVHLKHF